MNGTTVPTESSSVAGVSKPNISLAVAFSVVLIVALSARHLQYLHIHWCVASTEKQTEIIASGMAFLGPPVPYEEQTSNARPSTNHPSNNQQFRCVSSTFGLQLDPKGAISAQSVTNNDAPSVCAIDYDEEHSSAHIPKQLESHQGPGGRTSTTNGTNRRKKDVQMTRYIRPAVMLAGIVSVFTVCWFPFAIYYVYIHIISPSSFSGNTQAWLRCLLYANSAINPFIYAMTDRKLRQGYGRIWRKLWRRLAENF